MKKLLFIIGSMRENGFNYQLSNYFKELLNKGYSISLLDYKDIPYMNQDLEKNTLDCIKRIREEVKSSDGIVIFTPEYNLSYPGVLKNVLDWLSRPNKYNDYSSGTVLMNKKVVITGIGGKNKVKDAREKLTSLLQFCNMNVMLIMKHG